MFFIKINMEEIEYCIIRNRVKNATAQLYSFKTQIESNNQYKKQNLDEQNLDEQNLDEQNLDEQKLDEQKLEIKTKTDIEIYILLMLSSIEDNIKILSSIDNLFYQHNKYKVENLVILVEECLSQLRSTIKKIIIA